MPKLRKPRGETVLVSARIPTELVTRLIAEADANDRSLAAEVTRRLRMSFEGEPAAPNGIAHPKRPASARAS
jgi:hypothetical protein